MSYYPPRGGPHRRGPQGNARPRDYPRAGPMNHPAGPDTYYPQDGRRNTDTYRPRTPPPPPINDRYGPRPRSLSPGEYREARPSYDRYAEPPYRPRDNRPPLDARGREWAPPPRGDYDMDPRERDRQWAEYDYAYSRDPGPARDWIPRDRERDRPYDRRDYPPYDDRYDSRPPAAYRAPYDARPPSPPPPPQYARRSSPVRRNIAPPSPQKSNPNPGTSRPDAGWGGSRRGTTGRSPSYPPRSPTRSPPRQRPRSRSRSPILSPSIPSRSPQAAGPSTSAHPRWRASGAVGSFSSQQQQHEDDGRRASYAPPRVASPEPVRMDMEERHTQLHQPAPQPQSQQLPIRARGRSRTRSRSPPPIASTSTITAHAPTKVLPSPVGAAVPPAQPTQHQQPAHPLPAPPQPTPVKKESRPWPTGPRAVQQQPPKEVIVKKEEEKEEEKKLVVTTVMTRPEPPPFSIHTIPAKPPRLRYWFEDEIAACKRNLREVDAKMLAQKDVTAKSCFDLTCTSLDMEHASFRARVAERQRIHLEKGYPMEAYDVLEREGAFQSNNSHKLTFGS